MLMLLQSAKTVDLGESYKLLSVKLWLISNKRGFSHSGVNMQETAALPQMKENVTETSWLSHDMLLT